MNLGQTAESNGVEIKEKVGFLATFPPRDATIAPPPKTPTTKSTFNFLIRLLALNVAESNFIPPFNAESFVAECPPA